MKSVLIEKILKDHDIVEFIPITERYGRAEFSICPVVKRGKLIDIFIYPNQQPDARHFYRVPISYAESWSVISWQHKGMECPNIWIMSWCKEHKCQSFRVYVSKESHKFSISLLSNVQIIFDI